MVKEVCNMEVLKSFEVDESSNEIITLYEEDDNSPEWLTQVYQDDTNDKEKKKISNNSLKFEQKRKVFANNHNDNYKKINAQSLKVKEPLSREKTNDKNFELIEITSDDSNEKSSLTITENLKNPDNNELTAPYANTFQNIMTDTQTPQNFSFKNINQKTETSNQRKAIHIKKNNERLPRTKVTPHRSVQKFPGKIDAMKKHIKTNKKTEDPAKCQSKFIPKDQSNININVNDQINNTRVFPPNTNIQDPVNEKLIEMLTNNLLIIYPARYNYVRATSSIPSDPQRVQITAQELERRANRCFEASHSILTVLLEQNIPIVSTVLDCYRKKLANDKDILLDLNFFEWFLNKMINMTKNRQLNFNQYSDDLIRALKSDSRQQHSTLTNILSKPPLVINSLESTRANNPPTNATGLTSSLLFSGGTTDREIKITYEPSLVEKQTIVQHIPPHRITHYVPQNSNSPQVAPNMVIHKSVKTIPNQHITPSIEQQASSIQQLMSRFQHQPPNFQQQIPNFSQQMPSVQPQMPNVQQQMSSIQQSIPNCHQQAHIFQHQIPSFQQKMQSFQQQIPSALVSSKKTLNIPPPACHHQRYYQATSTQNLIVSGQIYQNIQQANANIDKPMNYNHNATAPATNIQQRSSVSRDSGIVSPRCDEIPLGPKEYQNSDADETSIDKRVPVISYVTSMNPDVLYSPEGKCHICKNTTNLRCLGCNRMYYCTVACQHADWDNHKVNCRTENECRLNDHTLQCLS